MSTKDILKQLLVVLKVILAFLLIAIVCILEGTLYNNKNNCYMPYQDFSNIGEDVNFSSRQEVKDYLLSKEKNRVIKLELKDDIVDLHPLSRYATIDVIIEEQSFKECLLGKPLKYTVTYNLLTSRVRGELDRYNSNYEEPKLIIGFDQVYIKNGGTSNVVDVHKAIDVIECNLDKDTIDLTDHVTSASVPAYIQKRYDVLKWVNDFSITYDKVVLDAKHVTPFMTTDGAFFKVDDCVNLMLAELANVYNTPKTSLTFKTAAGDTIKVPYKTFGKYVDVNTEREFLKECLETHTSVSGREISLIGTDTFGDEYIEISIQDQHIWHFKDNVICCESDIVTGTKGKHDTPTGVYYVSECIPGKYLKGNGYTTWVNRWMRLTNSGIGLHDATWRSKFGSDIYTYNGSHGCINLPNDYAYDLYEEIAVETPVVIY